MRLHLHESPDGHGTFTPIRGRLVLFVGVDAQGYVRLMKRGTETTAEQFLVLGQR